MNAKFVVAVFLALQVSLSLCEVPEPDPELVEKYNTLRATFLSRLDLLGKNTLSKIMAALAERNPEARNTADQVIENIRGKKEMAIASDVAHAAYDEVTPFIEKIRTAALGYYGAYLRPQIGETLNDFINRIKPMLDTVMPAREQR